MNAKCGITTTPQSPPWQGGDKGEVSFRIPQSAICNLHLWRGGFTLIELIVFLVLAGVILPFIFIPFMTGLKDYKKPEVVSTATFLGEELMEEIKSKRFDETPASPTPPANLGPESGEVRGTPPLYNDSTYDDVDDYNNLTENVSINNIIYSRNVTVVYVADGALDDINGSLTITPFKRIRVTVTNAQIPNVVLAALVSN